MAELKKILYAEDEPDVQMVVELTVQTMSEYEIKICDNGKKLLDCVEQYCPDLILLDVMMPEMDGPTTFKNLQLNENTKNIPVIFMTAKAQIQEVEVYKEIGALGVITKPFDPISLCDEIGAMWGTNCE